VNIPKGSIIQSCTFEGWIGAADGNDLSAVIYFQDGTSSPAAWIDGGADNPLDRTRTAASIAWAATLTPDAWNTSPNLAAALQEVVDVFALTHVMVLFIANDNEPAIVTEFMSYDGDSTKAAKLNITFTYPTLHKVAIDWDNDGAFAEAEDDITTDVLRMSWRRGREAELDETPAGSMTIEVSDPDGDYSPLSTSSRFGSGNVTIQRQVIAQLEHLGTTYAVFRGYIQSITPHPKRDQRTATIEVVDAMERLANVTIDIQEGAAATGGASSTGDYPFQAYLPGGSTGLISHVLDAAGWSSTARALTEPGGSTFDWTWFHNISAREALAQIEEHERGLIFVAPNGDVEFQSSTHRNAATTAATFGSSQIEDWEFELSARNVKNRAVITVHSRDQTTLSDFLAEANVLDLPNISQGSAYTTVLDFGSNGPAYQVTTPPMGKDGVSSAGGAFVGVGTGTTFAPDGAGSTGACEISGLPLGGGSAIQITITNNTSETVYAAAPEGDADMLTTLRVGGTGLSDHPITSTGKDATSIAAYGERAIVKDYPFFASRARGLTRATDLVAKYKDPRVDYSRMTVRGFDATLFTQLLTRDIGDKITVNAAQVGVSNQDYHINAAEYTLEPPNDLRVVWTLERST